MIALVLAAALAAAAPAAGEAASTPAKAAKAEKGDVVCKKEAIVGSRMKTRVCLPQAEWQAREVAAKEAVDAAQRNACASSKGC
jgi:hypothetical protein